MTNDYLLQKDIQTRWAAAVAEAERERLVRYCCPGQSWVMALLTWLRREPRPAAACCTEAA